MHSSIKTASVGSCLLLYKGAEFPLPFLPLLGLRTRMEGRECTLIFGVSVYIPYTAAELSPSLSEILHSHVSN